MKRRGNLFHKGQFWLDNLEPTPESRDIAVKGGNSFLEKIKRRGSEAIIKVKDIGVIWGGGLVLQTVVGMLKLLRWKQFSVARGHPIPQASEFYKNACAITRI